MEYRIIFIKLIDGLVTNKEIAKRPGKDPSTINREIKKGLDGSGIYHVWVAQVAYETNRKRCIQIPKLDHPANYRPRSWIVAILQKGWEPNMNDKHIDALMHLCYSIYTRQGAIMRTTVTLNDKIYKALKIRAAESGESISSVIEDAVKEQVLEDLEDLQSVKERENESAIDFHLFVKELKADGLL